MNYVNNKCRHSKLYKIYIFFYTDITLLKFAIILNFLNGYNTQIINEHPKQKIILTLQISVATL